MRRLRGFFACALAGLVAVALGATVAPSPGRASVVEAMSLAELTQTADVVVVARIEGQRSRYDAQGRIVTDVSLRVEESLWGRLGVGARATALRLGGVVGDLGLRVEGEAIYEDGERVILFGRWLSTPEGELLRPVGMSQGVLPIDTHSGVELVEPGGAGLELVGRGQGGQLVPAPGALPAARPRDEVVDEIRSLVAERARAR